MNTLNTQIGRKSPQIQTVAAIWSVKNEPIKEKGASWRPLNSNSQGRTLMSDEKTFYQAGWFPPPAPQGLLLCLPREVTKRGQFHFSIRSECRMRALKEFEQGGTMNSESSSEQARVYPVLERAEPYFTSWRAKRQRRVPVAPPSQIPCRSGT